MVFRLEFSLCAASRNIVNFVSCCCKFDNIARRSNVISFRPCEPFAKRHTTATMPAMISGLTAALVPLTGKGRAIDRFVDIQNRETNVADNKRGQNGNPRQLLKAKH